MTKKGYHISRESFAEVGEIIIAEICNGDSLERSTVSPDVTIGDVVHTFEVIETIRNPFTAKALPENFTIELDE